LAGWLCDIAAGRAFSLLKRHPSWTSQGSDPARLSGVAMALAAAESCCFADLSY
jgi:hypothetical protein